MGERSKQITDIVETITDIANQTNLLSYNKWTEAFDECNIDMNFYSTRKREYDEILPWDHIDCGVSKEFLIRENEKALKAETSHDCRNGCLACNINVDIARGLC